MDVKLKIPAISKDEQSPLVLELTTFIEHQASHIQQLTEQIQQLKDEIARLKNQPPKPKIRPSKLEKNKDDNPKSREGKRPGCRTELFH